MAIQFEFYKNPQPEKEGEEPSYHPRVVNFQHVTTQKLAREIHMATTFGKAEVEAMLMELSRCMGNHLCEGERVHLDGIGYFHPCLTSTEPVTIATKRKATKVKLKAIQFRADQALKNEFGILKVKSLRGELNFKQLTNEQIDRLLTGYFKTHQFMRRYDFQNLCGMARSTAMRHIRRLRDEGKLKNEGSVMQPIYVPGDGYYGNNE